MDNPAARTRFLLAACLAGAVCLGTASADNGGLFGANLLSNPSFEDYYVDGGPEWQDGESVQYPLQTDQYTSRGVQAWANAGYDLCSIRTDGAGSGHDGDYYGMGGRFSGGAGEVARMRQEVDLLAVGYLESELDGGSLLVSTGGWLSSWPGDGDSVGFSVWFLDANLDEISIALETGQQNNDTWAEYRADDVSLPTGTRFIRFDIEFVKAAGTNNDGRLDDAWVRIHPATPPAPMLDRNLLANPGLEAAASGWNVLLGNPRARLTGIDGAPSHSGDFFFFGGQRPLSPDGEHAAAAQDISLLDHGFAPALLDDPNSGLYLQVGGWLYGWSAEPVAQAKFTCQVYDPNDGLLASYDSGRVKSTLNPLQRQHEISLPAGTRRVVFSYDTRDPTTFNLDGYLDDAFVVITTAPHFRIPGGPLAIAHRGNSIVAPENTVAACTAAAGVAQLVEFDVRRCATGELVVIHDDTVDRTTDGTGSVASMSLAELQALDAGSWFSPDFAGERIPTMAQALAAILPGMTPLIERKTGPAAQYVSELQALGVEQEVILQSFDWVFLAEVHGLDPNIRLGALGSGALTPATLATIQAAGAETVAWAKNDVGPAEVALVHSAELELFVWTVNDTAETEWFIALGVDGIISDDPAAASWRSDPYGLPGDLDADCDVDLADLARLLANYGVTNGATYQAGDLDLDGDVDLADLAALLAVYGTSCE